MGNQLASVDNFKAVLNSSDIKARLKNSLKNNEKSNSFDKKNHTHGHFFENPL